MYQEDPGLEQRLSRFEAQLDRFSLALHQWQNQDPTQPASPPDVDQRIRTLEETLDREAHALRQMHEEPLKQLQAQAASLKDLCAAANHSVTGLDRAESRLAELQGNVSLLVNELSRSLQALVSELHNGGTHAMAPRGAGAAWPLDRVVDLHDELRRTGNGSTGISTRELPGETARGVFPPMPVDHEEAWSVDSWLRQRRWWYIAGTVVAAAIVLLTVDLVRRIEARLNDASARVASAERQVVATTQLANQEVIAARQDAHRQITEARQLAQRAETVGAILTAPDLVRINLASTAANGSSAQVLWSRTRGLVLSGSRLPAAPPDSTYQLWLVTGTQSISAGLFVPDAVGRASLVVDAPPKVPGPVAGAAVTIEPKGGRLTPSGQPLLSRLP